MPTTRARDLPKRDSAIKERVMPLLLQQHNVADLSAVRRKAKVEKLEGFVDRAIRDGLTLELVESNIAAGRPPHFIEGEHSPEPGA